MSTELVKAPMDKFKAVIAAQSVQEQFRNALEDSAPLFIASLIDLYSDSKMQKCEPKAVVMEALKAATLRLPINKSLGFAWLVPYDTKEKDAAGKWVKVTKPTFQIGWKGLVQLAIRTGKYRQINADTVYEGESIQRDRITGDVMISGARTGDNAIAYFAYLETVNGFRKTLCWTKEEVTAHAKKYSKSFGLDFSAWTTDFDKMALKTMIRNLIGKYGIMSIEMQTAMVEDQKGEQAASFTAEMEREANTGEVIDVEPVQEPQPEKEAQPDANEEPDWCKE